MSQDDYVQHLDDGALLFEEGTVGQHLYVVVSGRVAITRLCEGGEQAVASFGPGEMFGEMAVIEEAPRLASARAAAPDTRVARINQAQFVYLVSHQPVFALTVMEALSRRLRETTEHRFARAAAFVTGAAP